MSQITLPTDQKELVDALTQEGINSENEANLNLISWKIIDSYLAGQRRFKILDRWAGDLEIAFENTKGELEFRYEGVVRQYLVECGRFLKMDIGPMVTKIGESLGAMRDAGIAHATLGSLMTKVSIEKQKKRIIIPFLKYGIVGLHHYETADPDFPDLVSVISPRQLRFFPAWVEGIENLWGIGRKRWVPYEWIKKRLKEVHGVTMRADPKEDLLAAESSWGTSPPGSSSLEGISGQVTSGSRAPALSSQERGGQKSPGGRVKDGILYVPLEEIYPYDETGYFIDRFIIKIGKKIFLDRDFGGKKIVCPLQVCRHTDTGRAFSRGFVSPLIPFNDQSEKMLASFFKNITELDLFGTLFVPGSSGINLENWRTGPRPRAVKYESDLMFPRERPFVLQPANTGKMPAQFFEITAGIADELSGQGPMFRGQAAGRVDSAAGEGFLFNIANIGLGLPSHGLADGIAGIYARMLQAAKERLDAKSFLEIAVVDDAIAGVVLDPKTGTMQLDSNAIPDPWKVKIDVVDRTLRDKDVRKQELFSLYQAQLVDWTRYWLTVYQENLDVPGGPKDIWETWRKAVWQIIILFGDGKTFGKINLTPDTQNPDVQLMAVQQFMNKIEFSLASEPVQLEFEKWKEQLEILAGQAFPAGLGAPEDLAAQQQALQGSQGAQGQGGVPPV